MKQLTLYESTHASSPIDCANIDLSVCVSEGQRKFLQKKDEKKKNEKKSELWARLSFDINKSGLSLSLSVKVKRARARIRFRIKLNEIR